jgi:predicted nicotinamide N-methyase
VALFEAIAARHGPVHKACAGKIVLELGSGLGFTALALEMVGAQGILTELPDVLENLSYNVSQNTKGSVSVHALDVEDNAAIHHAKAKFHPDVIIAADVCYCPDLTKAMSVAFVTLIADTLHSKGYIFVTKRNPETVASLISHLANATAVTHRDITIDALNGLGSLLPYALWSYRDISVLEVTPSCAY